MSTIIELICSRKNAISLALVLFSAGFAYWMGARHSKVPDVPHAANVASSDWVLRDFGGRKYPVVYEGEFIGLGEKFKDTRFFHPIFSPHRPNVNPSQPRVTNQGDRANLFFDIPGEYYIELDNEKKLKVLVLARNETISANVLRLFDFLVANLVVSQGSDKEFYENSQNFAIDFFKSKEPKMLLCGPTLSFFEILLRDRFNLPVRDVTFTGVFMEGGQVKYSTHNVIEVYLPDLNKWVMFDVNYGLVFKWLDSFEITERIREASVTKINISKMEFDSIDFEFHYEVDAKRSVNESDVKSVFFPDMVSPESVRDHWHNLAQIYLGGPGYWGGKRFNQEGLSGEFHLYSTTYHQDPFLLDAQLKWQRNWDLKVRQVTPADLKSMLEKAYSEQVAAKRWEIYSPSFVQKLSDG